MISIKLGLYAQIPTDTIPFSLTPHNNISIQAILNEADTLDLMFHTAITSVSVTEAGMEKITSIQVDGTQQVNSWGGESSSRYSENNSLRIGKLRWDSLHISVSKYSGKLTDGKFGYNLFENKVIEVDFDHRRLIIHATMPTKVNTYEPLEIIFKGSLMFVKGQSTIDEEVYTNEFLLHTGFGGTLLFNDEFVAKQSLGKKLKVIGERELKDSYGNSLLTKKVVLPFLNLGSAHLDAIPIEIFDGAIGRQKMSVLGGDLIKRFNILLDLKDAQIYLKPNSLAHLPYADGS